MTDPAGTPRDDLQRPLDESVPVIADATVPATVPATADAEGGPPASHAGHHAAGLRRAVPPVSGGQHRRPGAPLGVRARHALRRAPGAARQAVRAAPRLALAVLRWSWQTCRRAARAVAAWSRRPTGRLALPATLITALLASGLTAGAVLVPRSATTADPVGAPAAVPTEAAPPTAPTATPADPTGTPPTGASGRDGIPADVLRGWAQQMSGRTGIPVVALQAYGYTELVIARSTPQCRLSWTTLAAIGRVESHHGRTDGATLQPDGTARPAIIGPPLDGQDGRKLIEDTDNGLLDGDPIYDRAIGPMQFIPETWRREQVDATGDGVADPHNIHDAALAAGNYLCRQGRDLGTATDWWQAVMAYNGVESYAQEVFDAANDYGHRSRS
jgi:membrane-bound lytic murein transglycosylase B